MRVMICKLDDPYEKYGKHNWFIKDYVIKTKDDLEDLMGFCGKHLYSEIYQIDVDDSPDLIKNAKACLSSSSPYSARDTIIRLFKMVKVLSNG